MRIDELKKKFKDEDLAQYVNVAFDRSEGFYVGVGIEKQTDDSFIVSFTDERGAIFSKRDNLTEEEACNMVYDYAATEKRIKLRINRNKHNQ